MSSTFKIGMSPVGSGIPNVNLVVSEDPEQSPGGRVTVAIRPSEPLTTEMGWRPGNQSRAAVGGSCERPRVTGPEPQKGAQNVGRGAGGEAVPSAAF